MTMGMTLTEEKRIGKIITFYSYKGGTGRSMALANVAFILASSGKRVLAIDWDLEAPGLHRYFEPFLEDRRLQSSTGLMDFFMRFVTAAVAGDANAGPEWFQAYSNLLAHAMQVNFRFPPGGLLEFVPAGRQDASYPNLVNSFNWQAFYEKLGGGVLLEDVKRRLRKQYDFILIDSRTGVSDTSGICTVQMPDQLVVCFTLNRQSISGASGAATSAFGQRKFDGEPSLSVWPLMTRVEPSEKERLEVTRNMARTRFTPLLPALTPLELDHYWGEVYVPYEPYYAYEEVLAIFRDNVRESGSMLAKMVLVAERLEGGKLAFDPPDDTRKASGLAAFTNVNAQDHVEDFELLADEYEKIREVMISGNERTRLMSQLVGRARNLAGKEVGLIAEKLFLQGSPGRRVIGLSLAALQPQRSHVNLAINGIQGSLSPFEQYHALLLGRKLVDLVDVTARNQLLDAVKRQMGSTIATDDLSRFELATKLLSLQEAVDPLEREANEATDQARSGIFLRFRTFEVQLGSMSLAMNHCTNNSKRLRYDDTVENHGAFLASRGPHALRVPSAFRISKYLLTNQVFAAFVEDGSYADDSLWEIGKEGRIAMLTAQQSTHGPAGWLSPIQDPLEKPFHPVSGIAMLEAEAFVRWCNRNWRPNDNWYWCLPSEDIWELAARGEEGLVYPWGDAFETGKCNSQEAAIGGPTDVRRYEPSHSPFGCVDMAGNLWEFMQRPLSTGTYNTVLRGGSYSNIMTEVRSYLRLISVPVVHRALDFGLRLAQAQGEVPDFCLPRPRLK